MISLYDYMQIFRPAQGRHIIDVPCEVVGNDSSKKSFDVTAAYKIVANLIKDYVHGCDEDEAFVPINTQIGDYLLFGSVDVSLTLRVWENESCGGYRNRGIDISKIKALDIDLTVYDEDGDEVTQLFDIKQIQKYL